MKKVVGAVITGALFAGLIVLLKRFDVAPIGPQGTEIGFSHINKMVHDLTGVNMIWYDITDFIGYAAILICALFAVAGFVQMVKRRSLLKVDREILSLGGLFAVVIACYVFFEKYIINYRPIVMPGEASPEASFPSSHTMLVVTVMVAVMIVSDKYFGNLFGPLVRILCFLAALVTVGGRLWCGVHWFTDIIGALLLSVTLLLLFAAVVSGGRKEKIDPALEFAYDNRPSGKRGNAAPESTRAYKPKH